MKSWKNRLMAMALALAILLSALFTYGSTYFEKIPSWENLYAILGLADSLPEWYDYPMTISFLDVGQGDAILVHTDEVTILIDTGDPGKEDIIYDELEHLQETEIDLCILTHPHEDHIGSFASITEEVPVAEVLIPKVPLEYLEDSSTYQEVLTSISSHHIERTYASIGQSMDFEKLHLDMYGPITIGNDINNDSIYVKITYGEVSLLITGDGEEEEEMQLLQSGADLSATVLKLGHHGSKTSSSEAFLEAVNPTYGIISCGLDNKYGHPHEETLKKLQERNISYFRTDEQGTIVLGTDGKKVYSNENSL